MCRETYSIHNSEGNGSAYLLSTNPAHHVWSPRHLSLLILCRCHWLSCPVFFDGFCRSLQTLQRLQVQTLDFPFFVHRHFLSSLSCGFNIIYLLMSLKFISSIEFLPLLCKKEKKRRNSWAWITWC